MLWPIGIAAVWIGDRGVFVDGGGGIGGGIRPPVGDRARLSPSVSDLPSLLVVVEVVAMDPF